MNEPLLFNGLVFSLLALEIVLVLIGLLRIRKLMSFCLSPSAVWNEASPTAGKLRAWGKFSGCRAFSVGS